MSEVIKKKKKKKNQLVTTLVTVFLLGLGTFFIVQVSAEVKNTVDLRRELKEAQEILTKIKQENVELEEQRAKLEDPEYVKSYARGTYMLAKDGEQIFFLPSSNDTQSQSTTGE